MTTPMWPAASYMMYPTSPAAPGAGGSGGGSRSPSASMRSRRTSSQLPTNGARAAGAAVCAAPIPAASAAFSMTGPEPPDATANPTNASSTSSFFDMAPPSPVMMPDVETE